MNSLSRYSDAACCYKHGVVAVSTGFFKLLNQLQNMLTSAIWNGEQYKDISLQIIALEGLELSKALMKGWGNRRLEIAYNATDHLALSLMEFNVFEFSASKTEARIAALSQLLVDKESLSILSFSDFKKEAEKITKKFNKIWLQTEYDMTIAVGQNASDYVRFMEEKDTVTNLMVYQTIGDNDVRHEHQLLEGRVFDLNDAEARDLFPPNGYRCRCQMVQHIGNDKTVISSGSAAKRLLGEKYITSQFNINRGDTRQVFTKKQFYSDIKGLKKQLSSADFKDTYNMESYKVFKDRLNTLKIDKTITKNNVSELFKKEGESKKMKFEDHLKRTILLDQKVFDKYSASGGHLQFPHVSEVLGSADEIWMHSHDANKGTFQVRYITFYKDQAIVVNTKLGDNTLEITDWGKMKNEIDSRTGLLIKAKKQ